MMNSRLASRRGFVGALAAGAGFALLLAATPALAHSFLVEATPSSKDHVDESPKYVKLRFGGGVEPPYSKLTLEDEKGKVVIEGNAAKPDKPKELSIEGVPALTPGRYVVRYRVLSTDGHIVEGNYEFFLDKK